MKKRKHDASVLAFVLLYSFIEIGALALIRLGVFSYKETPLYFCEFIPCERSYYKVTKVDVIEKEIEVELEENDSVDVIKDYMEYYIFNPEVSNKDEERRKEDEARTVTNSMDEVDLLYRLVFRESRNQVEDGMRRVCDVVLNRVDDPRFPDTIRDVILQPGQFSGGKDLSKIVIDSEVISAVDMELNASKENRLDNESIYFARKPLTKDYYQFKDHYFAK